MNLLCLHCGEGFPLDDSTVGVDGATVKCVHCGEEQPIYRRRKDREDKSGLSSVPPVPPSVPSDGGPPTSSTSGRSESSQSGMVGGFKKPMSSMWAGRTSAGANENGDKTEKMPPLDIPAPPVPGEPPPLDDGNFVIGGVGENSGEISIDVSGGPFVVHSPAILALEFSDFQVLDDWSRSIDKQEKYTIVDSTGESVPLNDYLKKRKSGGRAGMVRNAMVAASTQGNDTIQDIMVGRKRSNGISSSPTAQFEFKIAEEKESRFNKRIVMWVIGAVVVLGVLAASMIFFYK